MKVICDVHLPKRLVAFFADNGIEAIHGSEILDGWQTKDSDFCKYADENSCAIITKDSDFRNSHFLQNTPQKLIKVNLGNISNDRLINIFKERLPQILLALKNEKIIIEINENMLSILEG